MILTQHWLPGDCPLEKSSGPSNQVQVLQCSLQEALVFWYLSESFGSKDHSIHRSLAVTHLLILCASEGALLLSGTELQAALTDCCTVGTLCWVLRPKRSHWDTNIPLREGAHTLWIVESNICLKNSCLNLLDTKEEKNYISCRGGETYALKEVDI